jgi:hypothetical protein
VRRSPLQREALRGVDREMPDVPLMVEKSVEDLQARNVALNSAAYLAAARLQKGQLLPAEGPVRSGAV